uniref:Uncharacterized protein n=1 Tax=Melopsittacus undulatus TaxID=13146 RepID=A0A8C6JLI0_MELUD
LLPPRRPLCLVHSLRELECIYSLYVFIPLLSLFLPVFSFLTDGCGPPPNLTFAELTEEYRNLTEFPVGDTVRYRCPLGYMKHPGVSPTLTCLQNHTWSEALEFCKSE